MYGNKIITVEPPKDSLGTIIINSAILSLVERLSSFRRFSMYRNYGEWHYYRCPLWRGCLLFGGSHCIAAMGMVLLSVSLVERSNIQCPFLGGSFVRGSTVFYADCRMN